MSVAPNFEDSVSSDSQANDQESVVPSDNFRGFSEDWPLCPATELDPEKTTKQNESLSRGKFASRIVFLGAVIWASPWSLWGLSVGVLGLLSGGGVQRSGRILEFWGGILPLFLKYFPFVAGSPVATFGHVVVGRCPRHLAACRPHQMIHVKQYECWGPLFVPTYIACWIVLWCIGKRPYYDNPFEREAFDKTGW
jgi:hypothetical protein